MKLVFARATPRHSLDLLYSKVAEYCTYISIYFSYVYVTTKTYVPYKKKDLALLVYKRYPTTFTIRSWVLYCGRCATAFLSAQIPRVLAALDS
jgi:hypothetical protein